MYIGNLLLFLELAGDQNTVILNWDLLKQVAQFNDANQIEKKNDTNYQYDADGNLLQDEHFKYTYNEAQRLTSVQTLEGNTVASYTYDENGLRLTKTVGDTIHEYFYSNEVFDMEVVKKNGEVTQYRYYEWDGYTPLGLIVKEKEASGNYQTKTYQYITNQRGDVLSIRDQEDQEVGSYCYDAYGNVLSVEGDVAKDNPIRYAGYYDDEETQNYYLQARYYNPENGAFLALDPHPGDDDEPLSQNGYTYGNNNPVMHVDPNGRIAVRTSVLIGAINVVIAAALGYSVFTLNRLKKVAKKQTLRIIKKKKYRIKQRIVTYMSYTRIKWAYRVAVANLIVNMIIGAFNSSYGSIIVYVLKRYFKTYTKKVKKYGWWGKKVTVEYINFSRHR